MALKIPSIGKFVLLKIFKIKNKNKKIKKIKKKAAGV